MRADLPAAIAGAVAAARPDDPPALLFDRARLARNIEVFAEAARAASVRVLFAVKSFAHRDVLDLAAEHVDGFDVASPAELALVGGRGAIISIADPSFRAAAFVPAHGHDHRLIVSCETAEQLASAARLAPTAERALRLSASLTGLDPATGALLDGTGHRRSRFGLDPSAGDVVPTDVRGLHLHHGTVTPLSAARWLATIRAALAVVPAPAFINLGGAWHGVFDDTPNAGERLAGILAAIRAEVPATIELLVEPGRALCAGAGFALGHVLAARRVGEREVRVTSLSRSCHLRWSTPELVGAAPAAGRGRSVLLAGPTCYEDDVLGEWITDAGLAVGDAVVLRHVTGYAVGWNTGFGGLSPATVRMV